MKTYAIVLIAFGCVFVAATLLILCCLCNDRGKTKQPAVVGKFNTPYPSPPPPQPVYFDVERSEKPKTSRGKDGGRMVVLGAGAGVAAAVTTAAVVRGGRGGGGGVIGGGGDGGCGGCGGGDCGGGGCGGGC